LSLQLVDTRRDTAIWGQQFELQVGDLPRVEPVIVTAIARSLGITATRAGNYRPYSSAAYEEFLKARSTLAGNSEDDPSRAAAAFERVLQLDPTYAPAYAGLALACARAQWSPGAGDIAQWSNRALAAAEHALELNPNLADAHQAIASVYRYTESESRRALELDPSLDLPHHNLAVAFYHMGLSDLSDRAATAGGRANPSTHYEELLNRGRAAFYAGQFGKAKSLLERASGLVRSSPWWVLGEVYVYTGERRRAEEIFRSILLKGGTVNRQRAGASLASLLAASGRSPEARAVLDQTLRLTPRDHHATYRIGTAYAQLSDTREAVAWLRRSAETGFPCYAWFASDPFVAPLRKEPGFDQLLDALRAKGARWREQYGNWYPDDAVDRSTRPVPEAVLGR
jgi:Tfp pilus assembly protein PilF